MMDSTEVKCEFPSLDSQCRVCLSVGRKLSYLGVYENVFRKIITVPEDQSSIPSDNIQLCWECVAVLRRVCLFQQQVIKAQESFQMGQYFYGPLSNLATIVLSDTHPHTVYIYETNIQSDVKQPPCELSDHADDDGSDGGVEGIVKREEVSTELPSESKKPKSNRWATKRASQNKKPKFKMITDYTQDIFRTAQIKNEDVASYLQSQREGEYFKSRRHKCFKCVLTFDSNTFLEKHNHKYHSELAPYTCDICDSRLHNKRHLAAHIREHYVKYTCTLCDYTCNEDKQKQWHCRKKHRRVFQCVKCELKFGRKEFFKHYKEWHERFICDVCGVSFKMRYCIKDHIRKQHSPFECKSCNKRFARYNGLWLHNKTRHSVGGSAAYCVECDRRYPDVYRYRWHLANSARHNNRTKTRVACPGCDKVFSKNIYMKDHYNLVHLKHYKYRCEQCDKNFIRNADLVKHRRRIHEGILPPKNKICYICGRGFSTNKILRNHVRTHTGERPHACLVCGATFAQSTALVAHARALHTDKQTN